MLKEVENNYPFLKLEIHIVTDFQRPQHEEGEHKSNYTIEKAEIYFLCQPIILYQK